MKSMHRIRTYLVSPLVALSVSGFAASALGATYSAGIDNSHWYVSASVFSCSLIQDVPGYGRAVFRRRAGENLKFYLESQTRLMQAGRGSLVLEAPSWRPGVTPTALGAVNVTSDRHVVTLDSRRSLAVAQSLMHGMAPTVTRKASYSSEPIRVRVSNINFPGPYSEYQSCTAELLPVNFDQIKRSKVHFSVDKSELLDSDRKRLDNIIAFVQADPTIKHVFVDGHTDRTGSRIHNRSLSEDRAEVVANYLRQHGVDKDFVITRYHGEQYPAYPRSSENRRTTVRLERGNSRNNLQQAEGPGDSGTG